MSWGRTIALGLIACTLPTGLGACNLPPYTMPEQTVVITYGMFVPGFNAGTVLASGVAAFQDRTAPTSTFTLPKEVASIQMDAITLNLRIINSGPVPLRVKVFLDRPTLSDTEIYAKSPLGGADAAIELPRGGVEVTRSYGVETALLQERVLRLGYSFACPGAHESVTFKAGDQVNLSYSVRAVAKLI